MSADLWQRGCERLAAELPEQQFNTWIRPLPAADVSDEGPGGVVVSVRVPNRFKLDWIRTQYAARIEAVLSEVAGQPVRLELALAPREMALRSSAPSAQTVRLQRPVGVGAVLNQAFHSEGMAATSADEPARQPPFTAIGSAAAQARAQSAANAAAAAASRHRLNTSLTFDTLVPGRANQMARTAALHVAGAPGNMYNPLFIYGGVGLGKTHLIHAVGNALLRDKPDARILYLHAEQFISDVVKNYQRKTFDELKAKYHSLDLLLIDDVQFFAGKDRTQEEFFNAFEALVTKKAHIIMTSDTYPKGLVDIDERLTSRFDAGLTVAIEPPELEMRVAIVLKKAEAESVALSEDIAFFIAKHLRSNVRELEGALKKVLAFSRFSGRELSMELAKEALQDILNVASRQVSVEGIQKTVAEYFKIKISDMHSKKRSRNVARPRQVAMALAKDLTQMSLPEIGEAFGNRDHTTVLHACRTIASLRKHDTALNRDYVVLEQVLKG